MYKLTDAGRRSLGQWWASPIELPIGEREEIITKVVFASERGTLLEILDVQRGGLLRQIRSLNKRASHLPFAATAERLIVEKHIYDLEAQARWLDRVEALYSAGGKDAP
ncbi:hypothetical protein [Corynebacterium vitaeruminis]|uniref:hypothetical protein n=1 Tax=Corynebacterium vitaeruminis TaxID=38305 RepID=UPI001E2DA6E9|nr:hypothetical protein [Corynebacterium vitaeruminis]